MKAPARSPPRAATPLAQDDASPSVACALWSDNANDAERVMEAVVKGGKVVWGDGVDFWVEMF